MNFPRRWFADGIARTFVVGALAEAAFQAEQGGRAAASDAFAAGQVSNVKELRALSGENSRSIVVLLGYYLPDDGGGGLFYLDRADVTSSDDGGTVFVARTGIRWKRLFADEWINVRWFGAKGDNTADDTASIQAALNYFNRTDDPHRTGTVYSPPGTYKISSTVTLDTYRTSLIADSLWDASAVQSGAVLRVSASDGSEPAHSWGRKGKIEGLRISGGARKPGVIGIDFNSPLPGSNAMALMVRCACSKVDIGIRHANRAYNGTILQCEILDCNIGVSSPSGFSDYGEKMTYIGCIIFNNNLAVNIDNPTGAFFFADCSFDYNAKLFVVRQGQIHCSSCHFESSYYAETPIVVAASGGNVVRINGGFFSTQIGKMPPYLVEVGKGSEVHFDDVAIGHSLTSTDYFWNGEGHCYIRNKSIGNIHENPRLMHPTVSFMADGSFESAAIVDPIWLNADTATIKDRHRGANTHLLISNEAAHSGKQCLKFSKMGGPGSLASFVLILMPVTQYQRVGWTFWHQLGRTRRGGGNTQPLFWQISWIKVIGLDVNHIPYIEHQVPFNSAPFEATPQWQQIRSSTGSSFITPPQWANYFLLEINGVNVNGADILFDDVQGWNI